MFTRLYRHLAGNDDASFTYHAAGYGPGQNGVEPRVLTGDVNPILDFRFSANPRLDWYFDHHVSAFATPEDRAFYDRAVAESEGAGGKRRRMFHGCAYSSATNLLADVR